MFDPVALAEKFAHDVAEGAESVVKHADVRDALVAAASAILPGVDLPQEAEEVVDLLRAAGEVVHRAIDRKSSPASAPAEGSSPSQPAVSGAGDVPSPPEGFQAAEAPTA